MGFKTGVPWTDHTWNPFIGCHKVSTGCTNCYAFRDMNRYGGTPNQPHRASHNTFYAPLKWKKTAKVFVCSWSDFFIEEADAWRDMAWSVIRNTPHLTYQILTKRPERIKDCLPKDWGEGWPNVWLGVTAENQETANERTSLLLPIPATVHFVSAEPLLSGIDFSKIIMPDGDHLGPSLFNHGCGAGIDWIIAGGESGPNARPTHPTWVRNLRDQCIAAKVPFFFKQWGEWVLKSYDLPKQPLSQDFGVLSPDGTWYHTHTGWNGRPIDPDTGEAYMVRVGRKNAGHLVDGCEYHEFPTGDK